MVNKLERFAQIRSFDRVLEHTDFKKSDQRLPKGRWNDEIFGRAGPIILELGCGSGAYTLELARRNTDQNYVGVDIKGGRIWKGAKKARAEGLDNVRFLRIYIDHLDEYFARNEVHEIWITFSDPYPRAGDRDKRLVSPKFLKIYRHVLQHDGIIHFKTDARDYFKYACRRINEFCHMLQKVDNVYAEQPEDPLLTIQTKFEKQHLRKGKTISYCKFTLE